MYIVTSVAILAQGIKLTLSQVVFYVVLAVLWISWKRLCCPCGPLDLLETPAIVALSLRSSGSPGNACVVLAVLWISWKHSWYEVLAVPWDLLDSLKHTHPHLEVLWQL